MTVDLAAQSHTDKRTGYITALIDIETFLVMVRDRPGIDRATLLVVFEECTRLDYRQNDLGRVV